MAPCTDAMIKDTVTLHPDATVKDALDLFAKHNIRNLPVIDDNGDFVGLFGLREVLANVLPAATKVGEGLPTLEFLHGGAPDVAKKFRKSHGDRVGDIMNDKAEAINSDSATWEALRFMVFQGSPVPVVEPNTKKFAGLISRQTLLKELDKIADEALAEKESREAS